MKLWSLVSLGLVSACSAPMMTSDAGMDAGVAVAPDASLPVLPLNFAQVTLPTTTSRVLLASDGTTLYSMGTVGNVAMGTLRSVLSVSEDEGRTWLTRGPLAANALGPVPDGGLWALESQRLLLSTDRGVTFSEVPRPSFATASARLSVTSDGAAWLIEGTRVARFDGASFVELTVPPSTRLEPCESAGAHLVLLRDGNELLTLSANGDSRVLSLGSVNGPVACTELASGTLVATVGVTGANEGLRWPADGGSLERGAVAGFFRYATSGSRHARWLTNGRVDVSTDDGATWTTAVSSAPTGVVIPNLAPAGTTFVSVPTGFTARLPLGAPQWELLVEPGVPVAARVIDLAFAVEAPSAAMLVDDNLQRTVYVTRDGSSWRRGVTLNAGAATAIALSPDGDQVVFGALDGTYRVYADAGTTPFIDSRIETAAGLRETNAVQQLVWDRAQGGSFILATAANASDTAGSVWQLNPDTGARDWVELRPTSTTTAAAVRPGGYHAVCVAAEAPPPALTRSLVVGMRSNVSTNSFLNFLFTRQPALGSNASWLQDAPPVGFAAAISAGCAVEWGTGLAVLWPERRLWVGRFADRLREVPLGQEVGEPKVVRFDRSGRLWLGTSTGLWRTAAPVELD